MKSVAIDRSKPESHGVLGETWRLCKKPLAWWFFISCTALSFAPDGWKNFKERIWLYFDAGNYTRIAVDGYVSEGLAAFYPLWPLMMRVFYRLSGSQTIMGWMSSFTAAVFFAASVVLFVRLVLRWNLQRFLPHIIAMMILSPLSIVRVMTFTESLFSLGLMLLILDLSAPADKNTVLRCALWAAVLSLTRPMFPFLMITVVVIGGFVWRTQHLKVERGVYGRRLAAVFVASPLAYIPFGLHCQTVFQNFWMPFTIQSQWGRKFGFHWDLIFSPKVINGSNEVLVWDLIGFYGPLALFVWGLWYFWKHQGAVSLPVKIAFFVAVLIGCAHSAAAFLTYPRFMSIGRHVLTNPLPYLALLIALQFVPPHREVLTRRILGFVVFASCIFLGMWWFRYARDQWIG